MRLRLILIVSCVMVCWGCCTEETRQLARGVHQYQGRMEGHVKEIADFALGHGGLTEEGHRGLLEGQHALTAATQALSEILGEPRNPVEVDSW